MKKVISIVLLITALLLVALPAGAAQPEDAEQTQAATLDPAMRLRASDPNYNLYSGKTILYRSNGVQEGVSGWTNLTNKQTGAYVYHYTSVEAVASNGASYISSRNWGYGQVPNSIKVPSHLTMKNGYVYYGY